MLKLQMAYVSIGYASCPVFGMTFVEHSLSRWEKRALNPVLFSEQYSLTKSVIIINMITTS